MSEKRRNPAPSSPSSRPKTQALSALRHLLGPIVHRRLQAKRKSKSVQRLLEPLSVEAVVDTIRRSSSPMALWPSELLFMLAGSAAFRTVAPSEVVLYQHEMHYSSGLLVLVHGSAAATHVAEGKDASRPHRTAIIAPAVISESVVLAEGMCNATVVALDTCAFAIISSKNFWTCLSRRGTDRRAIESMRTLFKEFRRQLFEGPLIASAAVVHRSWLFAGLGAGDTEDLCRRLEFRSLLPGDVLTKGHEQCTIITFLVRGMLEVVDQNGEHASQIFGASAFGEMSVVFRESRAWSTVARTPCDMWVLSEKNLCAWSSADPKRRLLLLHRIARRRLRWISDVKQREVHALRTLLSSISFLAHTKEAVRDEILELGRPRMFPPGAVVVEKGTLCDGMYVLFRGKASSREKDSSSVFAGDTLGEFCLRPHNWPSTFVADSLCDAFFFPGPEIKELLKQRRVFIQAEDVCKLGLDMYRRRCGQSSDQLPDICPAVTEPVGCAPGRRPQQRTQDDLPSFDSEGWKRLLPLQASAAAGAFRRPTDNRLAAVLQRLTETMTVPKTDGEEPVADDPDFPATADASRCRISSLLLTHRSQSLGLLASLKTHAQERSPSPVPPPVPPPVHAPRDISVESEGAPPGRRGRRSAPSSNLVPRPPVKPAHNALPPRPTTTGSLHNRCPPEPVEVEELPLGTSRMSVIETPIGKDRRNFDGDRTGVTGSSLRPFSAGSRGSLDRRATVEVEMMVKEVRVPVKQQDALWCLELDDDDISRPALDDSKPVALFLHIVACADLYGMDRLVEPVVRVQSSNGRQLLRTSAMSDFSAPTWAVAGASCIACLNDRCTLEFFVCDNVVDDDPEFTASVPISELSEGARQLSLPLQPKDAVRGKPATITVSIIIIPSDDTSPTALSSHKILHSPKDTLDSAAESHLFVQVLGCDYLPRALNAVLVVMEDSTGKQLARSSTAHNSSAPRWLDLSCQLPIVGGYVSFQLWEDNTIVASATEEVDALAFAGVGKRTVTLFPVSRRNGGANQGAGNQPFGCVTLSILAIQAASEPPLALPSSVTIMTITGYDALVQEEPRDPFLVATLDGAPVIRTPIERQTASPRWSMAQTSSVVSAGLSSELFLQAFDGAEAHMLGYGVMPLEPSAAARSEGSLVAVSVPLSDGSTVHLLRAAVSLCDATPTDAPGVHGQPSVLVVHVMRCDNLVDAGMSEFSADPIVTIRFAGQKHIAKSTLQSSTQNPRWPLGSATAAIAYGDTPLETLIFEVWDGNINFNDFLGCVRIDGDKIPHGETTLALRSRGEDEPLRSLGTLTIMAFNAALNGCIIKPTAEPSGPMPPAEPLELASPKRTAVPLFGAQFTPKVAPVRPVQLHISNILGVAPDLNQPCWVTATDADGVMLLETTEAVNTGDPSWTVAEGSATLDLTSLVQNAPVTFDVMCESGCICSGTLNPWELATWDSRQMGLRTVALEPGDACLCVSVVMKSRAKKGP
jgi:CRP-like cAMP-binding protein